MGSSVEGLLSVCRNGSALLNKMVAMPIYGQKHMKIFSRTKKALKLNLGILILEARFTKFPRIPFDLFTAWSNLCVSCCGNTGRMLHGNCRYAMGVLLR